MAAWDTMNDVLTWMSDTATRFINAVIDGVLVIGSIAFNVILLATLFS